MSTKPDNVSWLTEAEYESMPDWERALVWAASQVGVEEEPRGSNRGPQVEAYLASCGLEPGNPWCDAFVKWCLLKAVAEPDRLTGVTGSVRRTFEHAQRLGALRHRPLRGFLGGHLNPDGTGHIYFITGVNSDGTWQTIEGNTNTGGSREGYGVFRRRRSMTPSTFFVSVDALLNP